MNNLTSAYIYAGGGTIDTNGQNVIIGQALLAPAPNTGIGSISLSSGGTGYIGAPVITITGVGGTGATAVATIGPAGNVTGITMTNPGMGYTALSISIAGGGGSGATVSGGTLAANVGGALTKIGNGTLTLTASNSYSGGTTVSAGTLSISADNNLGTGALTVNGGTLQTTAGITDSHALNVGASGGTINVTGGQFYFNAANTILGSGALSVTGGNLRSDAAQSYSGAITLKNGGSFEYGGNVAVATAATFTLNGTSDGVQSTSGELEVQGLAGTSVVMPSSVTSNGGIISFENGNNGTVTGGVALSANTTTTIGLRNWYATGTAVSGAISGVISGAGNLAVNEGSATTPANVTLSANNSFSGNITVSSGNLTASTVNNNSSTPTTGPLGNATAVRTISISSGATLNLAIGNVLGTGTLAQTNVSLVDSGTITNTSGDTNTLGPLTLNGGTLTASSGTGSTTFQSYVFSQPVTVTGATQSVMSTAGSSNAGFHLAPTPAPPTSHSMLIQMPRARRC